MYNKLGEIFSGLSVFSLFFVLALYFKGLYAPSTDDCGTNGTFLQDYWWCVFLCIWFGLVWYAFVMFLYALLWLVLRFFALVALASSCVFFALPCFAFCFVLLCFLYFFHSFLLFQCTSTSFCFVEVIYAEAVLFVAGRRACVRCCYCHSQRHCRCRHRRVG